VPLDLLRLLLEIENHIEFEREPSLASLKDYNHQEQMAATQIQEQG
tara:strand:+ start:370 stop:507 length:138 start_codon:yes stop_codon:yes gene_type:complete